MITYKGYGHEHEAPFLLQVFFFFLSEPRGDSEWPPTIGDNFKFVQ